MKLQLEPGAGALPVRLGVTRDQSHQDMAAIGLPLLSSRRSMDFYFHNAIQIDFDGDHGASFIGVSSHEEIELIYKGQNLFALPAREVFKLIAMYEDGETIAYSEAECVFPHQILTLYDADEQYDRYHGETMPVWSQIGIGNAAYLAAITKIRG